MDICLAISVRPKSKQRCHQTQLWTSGEGEVQLFDSCILALLEASTFNLFDIRAYFAGLGCRMEPLKCTQLPCEWLVVSLLI